MKINGLQLPAGFVRDLRARRFDRPRGSWELRDNLNAWGEFLETEIGAIYEDEASIQKETDDIARHYVFLSVEDVQSYTDQCGVAPGEIPYFWDFSKIVCFGHAGDGAHFCFDFREDEAEPSVIWWADANWQRVAPNYEEFIKLFVLQPLEEA